jgi:chaperonin GroEL
MIIQGKEVKEKLLQGIDLVANTVKPTLGPQAKTVILQNNPPVIINDGVTITKYISHDDPYVQMGIQMVQNLASQAQDKSGDGTTTACILAQALCHALRDMSSVSTHAMNNTLLSLKEEVLHELGNRTIQVEDTDILNVATIAANNDRYLGSLIQEALNMVGRDGIVTVEESKNYNTEMVHREGMEINEGYMSHLMCNTENGKVEFDNPLIFLSNLSLRKFSDIMPLLEYSATNNQPLIIFCKGMEGGAMNNLVMNLVNKTIQCAVVMSPNFGDAQLDELTDIKTLIGGEVFVEESKDDPKVFTASDLGTATKVVISKETTTIIGGEGDTKERINGLKELAKTLKGHELSRVKSRISRLNGGVATIQIGASSSMEMRETKERLDDALNATKAALESGIVLGGGMTLFDIATNVDMPEWFSNTLLRPLQVLKLNGGFIDADADELTNLRKDNKNMGYNALTNMYSDLHKAGVYDPVKVTKNSFLAAMSIASLFYSTEVAVLVED